MSLAVTANQARLTTDNASLTSHRASALALDNQQVVQEHQACGRYCNKGCVPSTAPQTDLGSHCLPQLAHPSFDTSVLPGPDTAVQLQS
jgi:hypothetical protein